VKDRAKSVQHPMMADERSADVDADPLDGRNESLDEKMDRNWNDILQELRVTQTGTQILTGFLLAIAFQPKFDTLTDFQQRVYLFLVLAAVTTTGLGLAPVNLHRGLFRRHIKFLTVKTAHVLLRMALVGVAAVSAGTVLLIFDVVVGRSTAYWATACVILLIIAIAMLPPILRRRTDATPVD
jgi:cation transport ATPase